MEVSADAFRGNTRAPSQNDACPASSLPDCRVHSRLLLGRVLHMERLAPIFVRSSAAWNREGCLPKSNSLNSFQRRRQERNFGARAAMAIPYEAQGVFCCLEEGHGCCFGSALHTGSDERVSVSVRFWRLVIISDGIMNSTVTT